LRREEEERSQGKNGGGRVGKTAAASKNLKALILRIVLFHFSSLTPNTEPEGSTSSGREAYKFFFT
jgi:hypothetical protein